ncbi:hypothetical protein DIS24_g10971 [Lasiodiplodia hormozganensis]|uniref:Uncharacterized protein n=1 Tax=Lasiodiplodia hormozganensis TaxID=869390 RepID=A0AA39X1S2_9PEZI|nr:hypothetical protein DIS24_g10971 [Lasiodiplodia hormozganensis]
MSDDKLTHSADHAIDETAEEMYTPEGRIQTIQANWGHDIKAWFPEDCHVESEPKDWPLEFLMRLAELSQLSGADGREDALRLMAESMAKRGKAYVARKWPVTRDIRFATSEYSALIASGGSGDNVTEGAGAVSTQPTSADNGVASAQSTNEDNVAASAQPTTANNVVGAAASSTTADNWLEPIAEEDRAEFDRIVNLAKRDLPKDMAPSATNLEPFYLEAVARAYINGGTRGAAFNQPKQGATIMTPETAQLGPYHGLKNSTGPFITTTTGYKSIANAEENEKAIIRLETNFHTCLATIIQDPALKATEIFKLPSDILSRLATIVEDFEITSLSDFQALLDQTLREATSNRSNNWPDGRKPNLSIVNVRQLQVNLDRRKREGLEELERAEKEGEFMIVKLKAPRAFLQGLSSPDESAERARASTPRPSPAPSTGDAPSHPQPDSGAAASQEQEDANQEVAGAASKGDTAEDPITITLSDNDSSSDDSDADKKDDGPTVPHGRRRSRSPSDDDHPSSLHPAAQRRRLEDDDDDDIQDLIRSDPVFAQQLQEAKDMSNKLSDCVTAAHELTARSRRLEDELAVARRELARRNQELAGANHDNGQLREQNRVLQEQHARQMRWRQGQADELRRQVERAEEEKRVAEEQVAALERRVEEQRGGGGGGGGGAAVDQQLVDSVGRLTNSNAELAMAAHQAQNTITGLQVENRRLAEENARLRAVAVANVLGSNRAPGGHARNQAPGGNGV